MLRLGKIDYANVLPVYYHFPAASFEQKIQVEAEIPAELNRKMLQGELDVGPISSFAYALHHDKYMVLPDLSVSSRGKVRSIFLFSKKPIDQLAGQRIAVTTSSATSVALLKVILASFIKIDVTYEPMVPNLTAMLAEHEAALLIGDDAIRAKWGNQIPYIYDLGEMWYDYTGKVMTYAVWVVQRQIVKTHSGLLEELSEAFRQSKKKMEANRHPIVEAACRLYGGEAAFWSVYFQGLSHDLTQDHLVGLETFYDLAYQNGLLPKPCKVELWQSVKALHS